MEAWRVALARFRMVERSSLVALAALLGLVFGVSGERDYALLVDLVLAVVAWFGFVLPSEAPFQHVDLDGGHEEDCCGGGWHD